MPTFTPRLAVVVVALGAISGVTPLVAQGTPAMSTIYLKEGGVIQGQILNDNDPNGVRIKSAKSGTTFLLKTVWIDSIVKAPTAPPVQAAIPAPKPAAAVAAPAVVVPAPAVVVPPPAVVVPPPAVAVKSEPPPPKPVVAAPVVDGLEPPPSVTPAKTPAAKPAKASSGAEKKPARFSHWYVGGGGSAPTGDTSTDIGYAGMLAYAAGVGNITQLRLGGAGNYWAVGSTDANVYDLTGTFDLLVGKRIPGFLAPYGLIGGVGGVRNTSPPPGFVGYARSTLYGARIGGGLNSSRIFIEVSYQKVWVAGTTSGYVPFVFGFRF